MTKEIPLVQSNLEKEPVLGLNVPWFAEFWQESRVRAFLCNKSGQIDGRVFRGVCEEKAKEFNTAAQELEEFLVAGWEVLSQRYMSARIKGEKLSPSLLAIVASKTHMAELNKGCCEEFTRLHKKMLKDGAFERSKKAKVEKKISFLNFYVSHEFIHKLKIGSGLHDDFQKDLALWESLKERHLIEREIESNMSTIKKSGPRV